MRSWKNSTWQAKADRANRVAADEIREKRLKYLTDEKRIKAVTVLFTDLEGRLHLLDYDKKFLLGAYENLTFDGSSIRGFTAQKESDLRLGIDWSAFYWVPADVFGNGKVLVFGNVIDKDGTPYSGDLRGVLKGYAEEQFKKNGYTLNAATEIEGFLFAGKDAERTYHQTGKFEFITTGGYYHSLPLDPLRQFIDTAAEVQRAMGFQNEKDHPEVAPSQFEINYSYAEVVAAADQIQLYKLLTPPDRQQHGLHGLLSCPSPSSASTAAACTPTSRSPRARPTSSGTRRARSSSRSLAGSFLDRILTRALDLCLIFNSSVNAYRRLDPHFEAPNQIRASAVDRGAMVRVPIGNHRSMRTEVRAVAPDANPYLSLYGIFKTGLDGEISKDKNLRAGGALPARQHPEGHRRLRVLGVDQEDSGRRRAGPLCRTEAGRGQPLPARAGHHRQGLRGAVPPRGLQPVAVELVLERPLQVFQSA